MYESRPGQRLTNLRQLARHHTGRFFGFEDDLFRRSRRAGAATDVPAPAAPPDA